jgi:hypothetical protein
MNFIEAVKLAKERRKIKRKSWDKNYAEVAGSYLWVNGRYTSWIEAILAEDWEMAYDSAYLPSYDDITTDDWEVVE